MHVVVWISNGQRYAMPSAAIVEVIPVVQSRPMPGSETWLRGLFNYRGELLPLLEWSRLLGEDAGKVRMASRILVVRSDGGSGQSKLCGLLVEHVLGTERIDAADSGDEESATSSRLDFLGPVVLSPSGPVQLAVPARLPAVNIA